MRIVPGLSWSIGQAFLHIKTSCDYNGLGQCQPSQRGRQISPAWCSDFWYAHAVSMLNAASADVDAHDGLTCFETPLPLHSACRHAKTDIARELLAAGADINSGNWHGWAPLLKAVGFSHARTISSLVPAEKAITEQNHHGSTPPHAAVRAKRQSARSLLPEQRWISENQQGTPR